MMHTLDSQFAKLYPPNAIEKSVVLFSHFVLECIFFERKADASICWKR
jgi:hypothetical protein